MYLVNPVLKSQEDDDIYLARINEFYVFTICFISILT